jgi:hypothetical protein
MVGRVEHDENGWVIIHEERNGPYSWITPYRISDAEEIPDWKPGDIIEFSINNYPEIFITLTDKQYAKLKLDITK